MEIERKHTFFHSFDTVVDTTLFREETLEAIVPDACPDMLEIIETVGIVVLTDKSAKDGQGEMTGEIRASVLYRSDADEAVRHMDVTLPFHCIVEHNAMTSESKLMAKPSLRRIDARALNPRKVLIRAEVAVAVSVRLPKETQMLCEIACEEKAGLQQKIEQVRHFMTV